jgi:rhamnosyltransferase
VGGFRETLTAEDVVAAAKLIRAGYGVAYQANALVKHSHRYSLLEEFRRYFDTGYFRALNRELILSAGGDEKQGMAYTKSMLWRLWSDMPGKIPYALMVTAVKLLGYRIGYHGRKFPVWVKRLLSSQPYYWK